MKREEAAAPGSDAELLVRRARSGDVAAFRSLYQEHVGRVHALALRLVDDADEAEELTQDVFIAAWRQLGGYRGAGQFSTWVHGIAVRMSRQRLRGLLRRRRREQAHAQERSLALGPVLPSADAELERALRALPRRMRTALVLHAIEGYTQAETAALMGVSEGTVKAHVHRARVLLHERMGCDG